LPSPTAATPTKPAASAPPTHGRAPSEGHVKTAAETLAEARAILGSGDAKRARKLLSGLVAQHGHGRHQAMASLLTSDSYLIEGRRDEALASYHRTALRYAGSPEGETAEFAAAELLVEQGARAEARRALDAYLARHPHGHFAREARERLGSFGGD
jgi:predicted Zn-dependent protease